MACKVHLCKDLRPAGVALAKPADKARIFLWREAHHACKKVRGYSIDFAYASSIGRSYLYAAAYAALFNQQPFFAILIA
jgi:hypothetical protein